MEISRWSRMKIADLPDNKDFHVFVCYTGENAEQVREIVKNLEENGMKCCYHERDFKAGESVMGNTHDGMKKSLAMLIVLTEEFCNSKFCSFELDEALHMKISDNYFMVPVKLEPCVVPDCLRNTTYIDAEDVAIERVHLKIINAFVDREIKKEQEAKNGQTIEFLVKPHKKNQISITRYMLDIGADDKLTIKTNGFELSDQLLNETEKIVNESSLIKYKHLIYTSSFCVDITIFIIITVPVLMIFVVIVNILVNFETLTKSIEFAGYSFARVSPLFFFIWIVCLCIAVLTIDKLITEELYHPNNHIKRFIKTERRKLNNKLWDNITTSCGNTQSLFVSLTWMYPFIYRSFKIGVGYH